MFDLCRFVCGVVLAQTVMSIARACGVATSILVKNSQQAPSYMHARSSELLPYRRFWNALILNDIANHQTDQQILTRFKCER
jgi:hypothetical protein